MRLKSDKALTPGDLLYATEDGLVSPIKKLSETVMVLGVATSATTVAIQNFGQTMLEVSVEAGINLEDLDKPEFEEGSWDGRVAWIARGFDDDYNL